ncbi:DMT family transporter [Fusobacterium simiae]|uniref:DMT family transporter n=1 Tax=Fusobacterium TaxID=848 RepID=UPI00042A4FA7|nr:MULTISPECIES: DMT family transporter [Fusobacterium]MDC7955554.1 DMT family transporter [Fusobacterium simiae]
MDRREQMGMLNTFIGGTLWGINGVMGSYLFLHKNVTTNWLVPYRLLIAGLIMLMYLYYKNKSKIFDVLRDTKDFIAVIIFGILGMMGTQYTYFTAIQYSNAAIATVLTYFGPTLVLVYVCLRERRKPLKYEIVAILLSMFGVFVLATHGNITTLQISFKALVWGMLSAMTLVLYTVQPASILKKYGAPTVVGWGMLIGGLLSTIFIKPWKVDVIFDFTTFIFFIIIIFSGTIAAFILYLSGVTMIGPTKASIIACIEPVSATIFSSIFMGIKFGFLDILGFVCIMSTVFIVAIFGKKTKKR